MKPQARVVAFDDGPFDFEDETVDAIGVVARGADYIEGILRFPVRVDGTDATSEIADAVLGSRHREGLGAILLDGASLGGFNVVDLEALHRATSIPVVSVTRDAPNWPRIEAALRGHFSDAAERLAIMRRHEPFVVSTEHNPLHVCAVGVSQMDAGLIIRQTTIRGVLPEPLRVAHLIAAALAKGESRGRA